ncbi:uncharacterized protein SAPINGB_P003332 [Magnusiomyces paraingens]|uniref:Uncharacterized protein n=1 Tax=Magnusiomyces paraingens TaxID=2606893 RepID=A0A5E8BUA4_9ASCO|nr:uncharacterized protein SAPINGB_P003332 [Saprochaete ingens]VVT52957.1 unnamed protein product [Saprochaete ingens]
MESDDDNLFVSGSKDVKIKTEPGAELTWKKQKGENISNTNTNELRDFRKIEKAHSGNMSLYKQPCSPKISNSITKSTSETLNTLYEGDSVIALEATPELVLSDENDDEVVQEYPVYYSTEFLNKLYLLQYPTRSAARPLVDALGTGILDSRIKPNSNAVEVDIPVDGTQFYDKEKGDNWGGLDKQTFGGIAKPVNGYMIGVFKNNELHLNPVHATAQLRPQFQYISQPPKPIGEISGISIIDQEKNHEKEKEKIKGPKAVQLTAKIVGDNAPSFSGALTARKKMEDESFVGMDWYDRDSRELISVSDKLVASTKASLISLTTQEEYIQKISSPHSNEIKTSQESLSKSNASVPLGPNKSRTTLKIAKSTAKPKQLLKNSSSNIKPSKKGKEKEK